MVPKYRTRAAAVEFAKYVDLCRNIAIRANKECRIELLSWDSSLASLSSPNAGSYSISLGNLSYNSTTWDILPEDSREDLSDDDQSRGFIDIGPGGEHEQRKVSIDYTAGSIGGPGNNLPNSIIFGPRGYLLNPASDFNATGYIEVHFANKLEMSNNRSENYVVMVTKTGMTRLDNTIGRRWEDYFSGTYVDSTAD